MKKTTIAILPDVREYIANQKQNSESTDKQAMLKRPPKMRRIKWTPVICVIIYIFTAIMAELMGQPPLWFIGPIWAITALLTLISQEDT